MTSKRSYRSNLNWLFSPSHGLSTSEVYDLIGTSSPTEHGLYLNLGYWRHADTMDTASRALAMLVAEAGGMGPDDTVLDCGFGFADQDLLWAQTIRPRKIIGVNITASQVGLARRRVARAGLADRVDLREGSATDLQLDDESIDLVVSLESAFHYRARTDFFSEASRVLRPGGRLVTADILPLSPGGGRRHRVRQQFSWYLVASRFNIPPENEYGKARYREKLRAAGFDDIEVDSIRDDVYAPMHRYLAANPAFVDRQHPVARWLARVMLRRSPDTVYAGLDYVLAVATKPCTRKPAIRAV